MKKVIVTNCSSLRVTLQVFRADDSGDFRIQVSDDANGLRLMPGASAVLSLVGVAPSLIEIHDSKELSAFGRTVE